MKQHRCMPLSGDIVSLEHYLPGMASPQAVHDHTNTRHYTKAAWASAVISLCDHDHVRLFTYSCDPAWASCRVDP